VSFGVISRTLRRLTRFWTGVNAESHWALSSNPHPNLSVIITSPIWEHRLIPRDARLVFVIMPFVSQWSAHVYQDVIVPAARSEGLASKRADEMMGRDVLQDIWHGIYSARLIVADLTGHNANVYYELGIAHTLGKKVILLTQDINTIPFDLRQQRIIPYVAEPEGYRLLVESLTAHMHAILGETADELSQVRSVLGGFSIKVALETLTLNESLESALVVDDMDIVGTRENVVLINKLVDYAGEITDIQCNHREVHSNYDGLLRLAALFDPPYVHTGTHERVTFSYTARGFVGDSRRWEFDVDVPTEVLRFELRAPLVFQCRVRIAKVVRPFDADLQLLSPVVENGLKVYRGEVFGPDDGSTYAIVWS